MQQTLLAPIVFPVQYQGNDYPCRAFERPDGAVYRIDFGKTSLFLTRARSRDGMPFWTAIPEDTKINHIVQELGALIEQHFKSSACATTTEDASRRMNTPA